MLLLAICRVMEASGSYASYSADEHFLTKSPNLAATEDYEDEYESESEAEYDQDDFDASSEAPRYVCEHMSYDGCNPSW